MLGQGGEVEEGQAGGGCPAGSRGGCRRQGLVFRTGGGHGVWGWGPGVEKRGGVRRKGYIHKSV